MTNGSKVLIYLSFLLLLKDLLLYGMQKEKYELELCKSKGSKVLIYLSFLLFL